MTEWTDHHGIRQQAQIDIAGAQKRVVRLDGLSRYPRRLRYRVVAKCTAHAYALVNRRWREGNPGLRSCEHVLATLI